MKGSASTEREIVVLTDDDLRAWATWDQDCDIALWEHFESTELRLWPDVYLEGIRISNLMFAEEVEVGSPVAAIFSAIAKQAHDGVFQAFAAALGVQKEILMHVLHEWYELDRRPPPIGFDGFRTSVDAELRDPFWTRGWTPNV